MRESRCYLSYDLRARFRKTSPGHWDNPIAMQFRNINLILGGLQIREEGGTMFAKLPLNFRGRSPRAHYTNKLERKRVVYSSAL